MLLVDGDGVEGRTDQSYSSPVAITSVSTVIASGPPRWLNGCVRVGSRLALDVIDTIVAVISPTVVSWGWSSMPGPSVFLCLIVECIRETRVRHVFLRCTLESLLATTAQFVLKQDDVPGVGFVCCISNIADEWDDSNEEIKHNVHLHPHFERGRQTTFDAAHRAVHHQTQQHVGDVANGRHQTNDGAPANLDTEEAAEGEIEPVSATLGFGKDFGFILGQTWRVRFGELLGSFEA